MIYCFTVEMVLKLYDFFNVEVFCLLGYNVVAWWKSTDISGNLLHPSLGSKSKASKSKQRELCFFHACFLLGLLFDPEGGSDKFFQNVLTFGGLQCYISENRTLHSRCHENLRSDLFFNVVYTNLLLVSFCTFNKLCLWVVVLQQQYGCLVNLILLHSCYV
jgi:hypothetical protein